MKSYLLSVNYIKKCAFKTLVVEIKISIAYFKELFSCGDCHELFLV